MQYHETPLIRQMDNLINFCRKHDSVYIYGATHIQKMFRKYLEQCHVSVEGFVVSDGQEPEEKNVTTLGKVAQRVRNDENIGIIMGLLDLRYNDVVPTVMHSGIDAQDIFFPSEKLKECITKKMTPIAVDQLHVEINIVDHCNLDCQCCDHYSQLAPEHFLDIHQFEKQIRRLAELTNHHISAILLHGGEPTLHDQLCDFIRLTRKVFPESLIAIYTNGLRLQAWEHHPMGNLWQVCHEENARIEMTLYPVGLDIESIQRLAKKYDTEFYMFTETWNRQQTGIKRTWRFPKYLSRHNNDLFVLCRHFNECITLRDGFMYTCPIIPYTSFFNEYFHQDIPTTSKNGIDIFRVESYTQIAEFLTARQDSCDFCDLRRRKEIPWKRSSYTIDEYVDGEAE